MLTWIKNKFGVNKNIIREFKPDIYPYTIWVSESEDNLEELKRKFIGFYGDSEHEDLNSLSSTDLISVEKVKEKTTGRIGSLIRFTGTDIKPGDISHEVVHVANNLYSFIGKDTDVENDEDYAYLVGWITNKIYGYE